MKKEAVEDAVVIGGLVGVQFVYAGNSVLLSYLMSLGFTPLTLVMFSALATFFILFPAAVVFERSPSLFLSLSAHWRVRCLIMFGFLCGLQEFVA